jgi:hypothetical protein
MLVAGGGLLRVRELVLLVRRLVLVVQVASHRRVVVGVPVHGPVRLVLRESEKKRA